MDDRQRKDQRRILSDKIVRSGETSMVIGVNDILDSGEKEGEGGFSFVHLVVYMRYFQNLFEMRN